MRYALTLKLTLKEKGMKISLRIAAALLIAVFSSAHAVKPSERYTLADAAIDVNSSEDFEGVFDTLLYLAVNDDEVFGVLTGNGQFTVFAPTDDAFAAVMPLLVCNDLTDSESINSVLKYHVVRGKRESGEVLETAQFKTLLGARFSHDSLVITDGAGEAAKIIAYDVMADNGVIHAIDKVLLPFPVDPCPPE